MELEKAQELAKTLFEEHHLSKWTFKFDNASRRFGVCKYSEHIISLSKKLTLLNSEKIVRGILLHEIAHALVRINHHHDKVWRKKAIEIGCDGKRCYGNEVILPPKVDYKFYITTCPKCGKESTYELKSPRRYACKACCNKFNNGKYTKKFLLSWKEEGGKH